MVGLAWAVSYADGRSITGRLPQDLPGGAVPRDGLTSFHLLQGSEAQGWSLIFAVELAEHERLVFHRTMRGNPLLGLADAHAVALRIGIYDSRTDRCSIVTFNGDGSMVLNVATSQVRPEPHEVG